jgi:hypothetical protein
MNSLFEEHAEGLEPQRLNGAQEPSINALASSTYLITSVLNYSWPFVERLVLVLD